MLRKLDAYLFGHRVGRFKSHADRTIAFTYDESWDGQDISLGLPRQHPEYDARPFLEGLLPENSMTRAIWEREYRIPGGNVLGMLAVMGKDAPGAIQFTPPGRPLAQNLPDRAVPLSGRQLEDLMRNVSCEEGVWGASAGQDEDAPGKFSLAGQQRKTALYRAPDGRWCLPQGCFPSTHIIKPQISSDFAYSDVNEAVCLSAMRRLGIKASVETIEMVGGVRASVIERYDRAVTSDGGVERFHQEDFCQILRCMPAYKYEQNGGPTAVAIARTIRKYASVQDMLEFVKQLAFNIAVAGTDAHGKNFSMLETVKGCSLAPAYDVASYLYKVDPERSERLSSSMQIGGEYRFVAIREPQWVDFASDAGLDADTVLGIVSYVDQNAADAVSEALKEFGQFAAGTPVADLASRVNAFRVSRATARQKPFRAQN
ncbi:MULTISPECIES: type II toxin-antitoxin system HipA family toxin [Mobiluncus]|uniref:type II toxin-antitoxin system HipA family toxin n=1 Tax=Mobiluncus TaxID=2050 RepID=UPI0009D69CD3|nr:MULTISPECIES: type II toxin-antitoxin system HipA family toxin [Mobiluncus]STY89573.1 Serine/threonine-protein kinase HipA [Mobiluncus holmesii]